MYGTYLLTEMTSLIFPARSGNATVAELSVWYLLYFIIYYAPTGASLGGAFLEKVIRNENVGMSNVKRRIASS